MKYKLNFNKSLNDLLKKNLSCLIDNFRVL